MITKRDRKMAKKSLHEEREAVADYTKDKKIAKSPGLKKAFKHALSEEKQHAKSFSKQLKK